MSFDGEFTFCMHSSHLPTPDEALESASEVLEFLDEFHHAAEAAGGMEVTLGALEAVGFGGLGAVAMDVAPVTAAAYAGAVAGCLIAATGSAIFDLLTAKNFSSATVASLLTAANDAGIEIPPDLAMA